MKAKLLCILLLLVGSTYLCSWTGSGADVRLVFPQSAYYEPIIGRIPRVDPLLKQVYRTPANVKFIIFNSMQGISKFQVWLKDTVTLSEVMVSEQEYAGSVEVYSASKIIDSADMVMYRQYIMTLRGFDLHDDTQDDTAMVYRNELDCFFIN